MYWNLQRELQLAAFFFFFTNTEALPLKSNELGVNHENPVHISNFLPYPHPPCVQGELNQGTADQSGRDS